MEQTLVIQIYERHQLSNIIKACDRMELKYELKNKRKQIHITSGDPMDFYNLGANVVSISSGLLDGPLTTS